MNMFFFFSVRMFLRPDLPETENRNVALKRAQSLDTGLSFHRGPGAAGAERYWSCPNVVPDSVFVNKFFSHISVFISQIHLFWFSPVSC